MTRQLVDAARSKVSYGFSIAHSNDKERLSRRQREKNDGREEGRKEGRKWTDFFLSSLAHSS